MEIIAKNCELASSRWDILALPGVELTHVPPRPIAPPSPLPTWTSSPIRACSLSKRPS
jgi:hypothetical protein